MAEIVNRSLVTVFSSPSVVETQLVRSLLAAEGIHATATDVNEPFAGLSVVPSEVLVWREDEARALALIQAAQVAHRNRVEGEEASCCDSDQQEK